MNTLFPRETQAVLTITALYMLRMLGLFMVLPVFRLYAPDLAGSTLVLIGVAVGIYGLSQALLQIPFSLWSDRIGRRPVIIIGMTIFALGSVVAAMADSIYMMILGRFLQGAGAISGALMAYVADHTSEKNRSKAMAAIGASIGLSFGVSMILGPMLSAYGGENGSLSPIFWVTALLSLLGICLLLFAIPDTPKASYTTREVRPVPELLGMALKDPQLMRLNLGIFSLHFVLMATFLMLPVFLKNTVAIDVHHHWQVYLPLMFFSFLFMLPWMIIAEKKQAVKLAFTGSVALLTAVLFIAPGFIGERWPLLILFFFFFAAFNFLEAQLPTLVSKTSAAGARGTAMGIYSTSQFFGAFCGGAVGGIVLQHGDSTLLFYVCGSLTLLWLLFALGMEKPQPLKNRVLILKSVDKHTEDDLLDIMGVEEALVIHEQKRAYIKVNEKELDEAALAELSA